MKLSEYQHLVHTTWIDPCKVTSFIEALSFSTIGFQEEAGEVAGEIKRYFKDPGEGLTPMRRERVREEMGDALAYLAELASILDIDLEEVLDENIEKMYRRLGK